MHQNPPSAPRASTRQIWRGRGRGGVWYEPPPVHLNVRRGTPTGPARRHRPLNPRLYPTNNAPPGPSSTMTGSANLPVPVQSQPPQNPQTGHSRPVHQTSDAKKPFGPNYPMPKQGQPPQNPQNEQSGPVHQTSDTKKPFGSNCPMPPRHVPPNPVPPHPVPPYPMPPYPGNAYPMPPYSGTSYGVSPYGVPYYPMPPYGTPPYGVPAYGVPPYPVPPHHVPHPVPQPNYPAGAFTMANYPHYGPYAQPLPGSYHMNHGRPATRNPTYFYPSGTGLGGPPGPNNGYSGHPGQAGQGGLGNAQQGQVANVPGAASTAAVNPALPMHQGVHGVSEGRNPQIGHTGRSETERAVPRGPSALAPTAEPFYPAEKPGLEAVAEADPEGPSAQFSGPGKKDEFWAKEPDTGASSAPVTEELRLQPAYQAPVENPQAATKPFNAGSEAQSEWPQGAIYIPQIEVTLATPTQEELLGCVRPRPMHRQRSVGRVIPTEGPTEPFSNNIHNSFGGISAPFPPAHRAELLNTTMDTTTDPSFLVLSHAQSLQRSALHAELRHAMVVEKAGAQQVLGDRSGKEDGVPQKTAEKRKARKKALDKYALELFEAQKNPKAQAEKQAAEQRARAEFEAEVRVKDPQSIMDNPQHPFWQAPLAYAARPSPQFPDAHVVAMHAENQELVSAFEIAFHNMASFAYAYPNVQTRPHEPRARSESALTVLTSSHRSRSQSWERHVPRNDESVAYVDAHCNACLVPSSEQAPTGHYGYYEPALGHGMTATAHVPTPQMPLPSLTLPSLVDPGAVHQIRVLNPTLPPFASPSTTRNVLVATPPPPPFTFLRNASQVPPPNPTLPLFVNLSNAPQMPVPVPLRPAFANLSTTSQMEVPNSPQPAFVNRSTLVYQSILNLTERDFQNTQSRFKQNTPSRRRTSSCTAQRDTPVPTIERCPPLMGLDDSSGPPSPVVDRAEKIREANARYRAALEDFTQLLAMQPRDNQL